MMSSVCLPQNCLIHIHWLFSIVLSLPNEFMDKTARNTSKHSSHLKTVFIIEITIQVYIKKLVQPVILQSSSHLILRHVIQLIRDRTEATVVLQAEWTDNLQEMLKLSLSIGQSLSVEAKLTRFEAANDKLVEALEQAADDEAMQQFQTTLDEESELIDDAILKICN